jgi:hypothetical protein
MKQHYLRRYLHAALLSILVVAATTVQAAPTGDIGYTGVLDDINIDGGWLVIDDQAVWYGPELKVRLPSGVSAVGAQALKIGSGVNFIPESRDGRPYVSEIRVLQTRPTRRYDEGTGDD